MALRELTANSIPDVGGFSQSRRAKGHPGTGLQQMHLNIFECSMFLNDHISVYLANNLPCTWNRIRQLTTYLLQIVIPLFRR